MKAGLIVSKTYLYVKEKKYTLKVPNNNSGDDCIR